MNREIVGGRGLKGRAARSVERVDAVHGQVLRRNRSAIPIAGGERQGPRVAAVGQGQNDSHPWRWLNALPARASLTKRRPASCRAIRLTTRPCASARSGLTSSRSVRRGAINFKLFVRQGSAGHGPRAGRSNPRRAARTACVAGLVARLAGRAGMWFTDYRKNGPARIDIAKFSPSPTAATFPNESPIHKAPNPQWISTHRQPASFTTDHREGRYSRTISRQPGALSQIGQRGYRHPIP